MSLPPVPPRRRAPRLPPPPPRRGTAGKLRQMVRRHEEEERPFDPRQPPTWRGSSRDLVANRRRFTMNPSGFREDLHELVSRYHRVLNTEKTVDDLTDEIARAFDEEDTDDAMRTADELLEGHGVEALGPVDMHDGPPYTYINFGDTYDPTIMWSRDDNKVFVAMGGWGDVWSEEGEGNAQQEAWEAHIGDEFERLVNQQIQIELDNADEGDSAQWTRAGEYAEQIFSEGHTRALFDEAMDGVNREGKKYPEWVQESDGYFISHMDAVVDKAVDMLLRGWRPKHTANSSMPESVRHAVADLSGAAVELESHWEQQRGHDFAEKYPFRRSFDEVTHDLLLWRERVAPRVATPMLPVKDIGRAFLQFHEALERLDEVVRGMEAEQQDDLWETQYPFDESLDEVVYAVGEWGKAQGWPVHRARHVRHTPNGEHIPTDYAEAKAHRDRLEAQLKRASDVLRGMSGGGAMGMTPDDVRATPRWREAKREADAAMGALQEFNTHFVRRFRKEIAEDRDHRRHGQHARNGEQWDHQEFERLLRDQLRIGDRQIRFGTGSLGGGDLYVNFYNLPEGIGGAGGGAEAENNRMTFTVSGPRGQGIYADDRPIAAGVVRVEQRVSALPREYRLRAKSGTPAVVARYLADFLNKVAREVEPKFTHTRR